MNSTKFEDCVFNYTIENKGNNFVLSVTLHRNDEYIGYAYIDAKGNQADFVFYEVFTNEKKYNVYLYRFCIEKVRAIILRIAQETDINTICPLAIIRFEINRVNRVNVFDYLFNVWDFEKGQ